jgi:hypothetical protein
MSYDEIGEQLDLPRIKALNAYHRENPPLHLMVASYLGFGEKPKPVITEATPDLFAELGAFQQP